MTARKESPMDRDQFDQCWWPLAQEVLTGMKEWRLQHPPATLAEIEAALDARLRLLRARMPDDAALASAGAAAGAEPDPPRPPAPAPRLPRRPGARRRPPAATPGGGGVYRRGREGRRAPAGGGPPRRPPRGRPNSFSRWMAPLSRCCMANGRR